MHTRTGWFDTYPQHTFNSYSYYLKSMYNKPAYRVSVDAGFDCPHRKRETNNTGCVYCAAAGSRAPYLGNEDDIRFQIQGGISFLKKRYKARIYLLYFQAFSNTNAPVEQLKKIYDFALSCASFKELIIATRPDCINSENTSLLTTYIDSGLKVWVELGLQSASDKTLNRINRKHTRADFLRAFNLLKQKGIHVTPHLIFGLPGEGEEDILRSIKFLAHLQPDGIKIHNLHIPISSPLFKEYLYGEIVIPCSLRHRNLVIKALELLPPETVIIRVTSDAQKNDLASPLNFWGKARFYDEIRKEMAYQKTWQGKKYQP